MLLLFLASIHGRLTLSPFTGLTLDNFNKVLVGFRLVTSRKDTRPRGEIVTKGSTNLNNCLININTKLVANLLSDIIIPLQLSFNSRPRMAGDRRKLLVFCLLKPCRRFAEGFQR